MGIVICETCAAPVFFDEGVEYPEFKYTIVTRCRRVTGVWYHRAGSTALVKCVDCVRRSLADNLEQTCAAQGVPFKIVRAGPGAP